MLAYLQYYLKRLPDPVANCVGVAKGFEMGELGASDLLEARERCWVYHDDPATSATDKSIARAALCLLSAGLPNGADFIDLVDFFLDRANEFEDHSDRVDALVEEYFQLPAFPPNRERISE